MPTSNVIDIRLTDLRQFFNSLDPSLFHDKDLDRNASSIAGAPSWYYGCKQSMPSIADSGYGCSLQRRSAAMT